MNSRYECNKCGTTMDDVERKPDPEQFCPECYEFALKCWQFVFDCLRRSKMYAANPEGALAWLMYG